MPEVTEVKTFHVCISYQVHLTPGRLTALAMRMRHLRRYRDNILTSSAWINREDFLIEATVRAFTTAQAIRDVEYAAMDAARPVALGSGVVIECRAV